MSSEFIAIVIITVLLIFALITLFIAPIGVNKNNKEDKEKENKSSDEIEFNKPWETDDKIIIDTILSENSFDKCNNFLDSIIRMHMNNYKVLTGFTPDSYITRDTKDEMVSYVTEMTKHNMTDEVLWVVSMFYDINTKEDLNKLLDLRIKLNILADMVEQNAPIE